MRFDYNFKRFFSLMLSICLGQMIMLVNLRMGLDEF